MAVRIGVDVGGTFTKAVACASSTGAVVARAITPTSHSSVSGVADGVIRVITDVCKQVAADGQGPVELVAHSTTQAVNALLEGDTSVVGVLGMGRRPDLKRASKRTAIGEIRLAPGHHLVTRHSFIDVSESIDEASVTEAIHRMVEDGAQVIVVSEAFGVDDARGEWLALRIAEEMGVPACAGHELTGLYGLEMRTVTAALNASILPTALSTARLVEEAVRRDLPDVSLLVMRGDGGAVNLDIMKRQPLLTAFSGPAASVAGALRHIAVRNAVVIEVGGTSTNVSAIKSGRPVLSYVRVLDHTTCVRSLDVRVAGVAGGSLIRVGKRMGRAKLLDVGPRSAHIAGLPYACFASQDDILDSAPRLIAPKPGDPAEYLVLETKRGHRIALTLTCAANALGTVASGSYAEGDGASARVAFEIAGRRLGVTGEVLAKSALAAATDKLARLVRETADEQEMRNPVIVGVGGGAGALIPALAGCIGSEWEIPKDAEVISSIGDALSVVRVEIERTLPRPSAQALAQVHHEAEEAALRAGASPASVRLESTSVPERGALRVTAFGAVALEVGAPAVGPSKSNPREIACAELGPAVQLVFQSEFFSAFCTGAGENRDFVVIDRSGAVSVKGKGRVLAGQGCEVAAALEERIPALVRHFGPIAVAPAVRFVRGSRLVDLTLISSPADVRQAVLAECAVANDEQVVALLSRS